MTKPLRHKDKLDDVAYELGHITMEWSRIEGFVDEFIWLLAAIPMGSQIGHIIAGNADIRNKLQMLKGLAFVRHFDKDWLDDVLFMIDHIDNNIRVRRNAVIHAEWFIPRGRVQRRTRKTKLLRPQAHQLVLETEQNIPVRITELRALTQDLQHAWIALMPLLWFMYDGNTDGLIDPETSPTISYKQYLRWAGLGYPARRVRQKLRRQQQSSRRSKSQSKAKAKSPHP